ncbi:MAG: sulfotransferase [Burkholderiales bacterium]|nr:sulfotransferase [Burkholderiales bacterium]
MPAAIRSFLPGPAPFFLVGAPRSGTTVLRLLLGHHPRICRCDEIEYVASAIAGRTDWPEVASYVRDLPQHIDFRSSGFVPDASLSFPELVNDFFVQLRAADGCELAGATVHNHFDELLRIWPDARFIHLDRDPRDVARSCVAMGWAGNAWAGAEFWMRADAAWSRLCAVLPEDRRLEVKFDGLASDAEAELSRITAFLGVDFDPEMLEIERDTTYRRPHPRGACSWRDDASEDEVRQVEARLGPRLLAAGHAPSGLPPLRLSPLGRVALQLGHRIGRMRSSQKRYGLLLWAAASLARRLAPLEGFRAPRRRARAAMDAIDETRLK